MKLTVISGVLHFPIGGVDANYEPKANEPSLLVYFYPSGEVDTLPWPLTQREYSSRTASDLRRQLAGALYNERESNPLFPQSLDTVELPDGQFFNFDVELTA
jgi:hypothetical protein